MADYPFPKISRREFASLLGLGLVWPLAARPGANVAANNFRIRTITAGLQLHNTSNLKQAENAVAFLHKARMDFQADGYEVQTLRLATQPLGEYLPNWMKASSLQAIQVLDRFAVDNEVMFSIGPVITSDFYHPEFSAWAEELVQQTKNISFTVCVASPEQGIHHQAVRSAAEAIQAIAQTSPGGEGNFRFAATAHVPAGTPFFPAAWFAQGNTFSIGLESPNLLSQAFQGALDIQQAKRQLKAVMETAFGPVAEHGRQLGQQEGWEYLGIDVSPAPGLDASIGQAIESLSNAPFGSPSTLSACAAITDVLKSLNIEKCGYSGLMLPVLEDTVLAQRAIEGRYGVSELLLFSSVCGTGLDVVPLPGDTPVDALAAVVTDVAALAAKYRKPLSARLFPVPGKHAGERVNFDNPFLTETVVLPLA
jgi:uncharacterized protein (UPF0210 family)